MVEMGNSQWVIQMQEIVYEMNEARREEELWKKRSIYRIPPYVTNINKKAYEPQVVAFGPYHHGEEHLKSMEVHKQRALLHFLKRSGKPLDLYIQSLAKLVKDLKASYDSLDDFPEWTNGEAFLHMMILDGCFMLEVMRMATKGLDDYSPNDPIFSNHGTLNVVPYIVRDMLLLENQLPLSLLCNLVATENGKSKDVNNFHTPNPNPKREEEEEVIKLVLNFYNLKTIQMDGKCLHVLDIIRKSLLWQEPDQTKILSQQHDIRETPGVGTFRSATELNNAGIKFIMSKTQSIKDISFKRGTLELPSIIVDDTTESMLLNLIAFERFHVGAGKEVTSFIFFMQSIISNAKDASLLHSRGIIGNAIIGSDEAVAKLFNSLAKDLTLDPESGLNRVYKKVDRYCRQYSKRWRLNFIHTYNRSPWAIVSVFAAIVLFVLSFIQTIYTVYPYYHPLKK